MKISARTLAGYSAILLFGVLAPFVFPTYTTAVSMLWIMIVLALTWDILGGQMGYNSLGNIFYFGAGMYISAIVQIGLYYNVAEYTSSYGAIPIKYTMHQYLTALGVGIPVAAVAAAILAIILGWAVFGLRGPYFAIGTLGIALAAGELTGTWRLVGAGAGISMPVYPGEPRPRELLFYFLCFGLSVVTFLFLRWLYSTRFALSINAIRDDEEKAEAMGLHTLRYKTIAWSVAAFFLAIAGAIFGNMTGFIEPLEVAFPTVTFGIFMIVMTLLGGKGTLWGPILGATLFYIIRETTWTYLLGWQWIALGALIVVNIVFFQQGILGWAKEKWPERFGIRVEQKRGEQEPWSGEKAA